MPPAFLLQVNNDDSSAGSGLIALIVILLTIGVGLFWFVASVRAGESILVNVPVANRMIRRMKYGGVARRRMASFLSDIPYFAALSPDGQDKFIDRLSGLLVSKDFTGHDGLEVTEQMKVRVAACAVQLTYGLHEVFFSKFDTFDLYPHAFRAKFNDPAYIGAINERTSTISLSMKDFEEGYRTADDNKNVGLHEMAQAFLSEIIDDQENDEDLSDKIYNYQEQADVVFAKLKSEHSFMEDAAFKDKKEFFSACIVHFFETPEQFSKMIPEFYGTISRLLNQDPLNKTGDYVPGAHPVETVAAGGSAEK